MAMDFWEAQRQARRKTTLYLTVFILLTLVIAALSEFALRYFAQGSYNPPIPYLALFFLALTFGVAGYQYSMYQSYGGSYVAESVGAWQVDPNTTDRYERQLLNIVEEVAVASSLPIPPVYILDAEEINAFAAGLTHDSAAITVTEGSISRLNRDELQGVIAHEFGHISNGDMKISTRLAAMLMGFFFVLYIGLRILEFSGLLRGGRDDNKKGPNPIVIAALILLVAGAVTWFAGSILKSMVSRQREYLADACAVQFTRNPSGIANALRKISKETVKDMPKSGAAFSHLYLNDQSFWSTLFATHPPIEKRIAAIEAGTYLPEEDKKQPPIPPLSS